jgi:hypothetical protein
VTIVLIGPIMPAVFNLATRIIVLPHGAKIAEGSSAERVCATRWQLKRISATRLQYLVQLKTVDSAQPNSLPHRGRLLRRLPSSLQLSSRLFSLARPAIFSSFENKNALLSALPHVSGSSR